MVLSTDPERADPEPPASDRTQVDLAEMLTLWAVTVVALVAIASLSLAMAGANSLPLMLVLAVVIGAAVAVVLVRWGGPIERHGSLRTIWPLIPAVLAVLVLSFPGFHYATGDKDPGVYVMHATSIARTGELTIPKSPLQLSGALTEQDVPGAQWRGFEFGAAADTVIPSFYHLWPSLLAVGFEAVGFRAISVVVPLLALLGTVALFMLTRRLADACVAGLAALLLATNMMQVWQSRYPTAEIFGQTLFVGALLAMVIALQANRRAPALLAGLLATSGFLNRGEGVAVVLVFGAIIAAGFAWGRRGEVCAWAAGGLLLPLPLAFWQAYHTAERYSSGNGVPAAKKVVAVLLLEALVAVVGSRPGVRARLHDLRPTFSTDDGDARRWLKLSITIAVMLLALVGVLRPLFGDDYFVRNGSVERSWDERSLHRLALFFTWPGVALAVLGIAVVFMSRWRLERILTVGVLLTFTVLFLRHAKNSPQMMWWGRRYIPIVVPGIVILGAIGAVYVIRTLWFHKPTVVVACIVVAFVLAVQFRQSFVLRSHDEKAGSYGVALSVAALSGEQRGVFLWQRGPCCAASYHLFGSTTWMLGEVDSGVLPGDPVNWGGYLDHVAAAAPDQPLYAVLLAGTPPPDGTDLTFTMTQRFTGSLPVWEESNKFRPSHAQTYKYDFVVYEVSR
jgi:hypothetical protein